MIHRAFPIVAGLTLAAPALAAAAAPAGPLAVTTRVLTEQRHAAPDGTTRITLGKPTRVSPGDGVVVAVGYRNTGAQALGDVVLADPLPASITYRGPRAGSPEPEVSVDGRRYAPLAALVVATPAGGTRPARAADVTAVRWRLSAPLAPGGQGEFAFQGALK
ncbi:MAG: hypothetical protein ACRYFW_08635 [Janthinobacterium lividum]